MDEFDEAFGDNNGQKKPTGISPVDRFWKITLLAICIGGGIAVYANGENTQKQVEAAKQRQSETILERKRAELTELNKKIAQIDPVDEIIELAEKQCYEQESKYSAYLKREMDPADIVRSCKINREAARIKYANMLRNGEI